jgi:hypothetical protein
MTFTRRQALITGLSAALSALGLPESRAEGIDISKFQGIDDFWLATDAYVFGYPLVTMEMTRRVVTNVAGIEGTRGPMGQLIKLRQYPNASFRDVTAPNADTLYTTAFFDVGKEPWVLSVPDMNGRYFLLPMLDGWTNVFAVPGKRTTGTGAQKYAICGQGWSGSLPPGVKQLTSPTNIVWLLGRIYCTGTPEDYAAVHALQDQFQLTPLSAFGQGYSAPPGAVDASIDMKTAVREQVDRMSTVEYFTLLAQLMNTNPPAAADVPELARFAKIGLVPGKEFDASKLPAHQAEEIPRVASARIMQQLKHNASIRNINGWIYDKVTGIYGTDYLNRALVTVIGLGANRVQDAIYPFSQKDADGHAYAGAHRYVVHFAKGQTPPISGFWSITMYDTGYFFVENPINRYSISPRQNLKANPDGSIDIYIQRDSPGEDKQSNWLPSPAGEFYLMLRMYWPNETSPSIINGSWTPPRVKRVA